jgi:serine/threonine-protein kinase
MSTVFQANDPNLRRKVAIKIVHPHLSDQGDFVRRFEQEATAVAQLRHHHIIQVYDFDHDEDENYFMVLEHVPGETLQSRLKKLNEAHQKMPLTDVMRLMINICEAVDYAHRQGMIHRDLKPANVMLNPQDEPILMDFGVAKMLSGTDHTATGTIIGTALYMSPEQARGDRPDERSDVYSLGVMLYEMVSGRPPFDGETAITIMFKHLSDPIPDICQFNAEVPEELIRIIDKVLDKDPAKRYQTPMELAEDLQAFRVNTGRTTTQQTTPISVPVAAAPDQASPKQRGLVGGLALIVGLLIVGAIFAILRPGQSTSPDGGSLPLSAGMVKIPGGTYQVGRDDMPARGDYEATQQVNLETFWIDQYEVTNADYARFLAQADFPSPGGWSNDQPPAELGDHPVEGVTWDAAAAYCQSIHKRLPGEAEWEVAARGALDQLYPWGNDAAQVALPNAQTYPVGSIVANRSPFDVYDMAGNVWEWVDQIYAPLPEGDRLLRGGAHGFLKDMAYRLHGDPTTPSLYATAGIRCAADQVEGE